MADPVISIIVPVYNVCQLISKCLSALLNQTLSDIEIIVVNDGSTDGSGDICDQFASRDKRVRVFHQKNKGVSAARNTALHHSKGQYIAFCDADDWMEPEMLSVLCTKLNETNADAAFCGYYEEKQGQVFRHAPETESCVSSFEAVRSIFESEGYFTSVWNKVFRRSSLYDSDATLHEFDTKICVGEDELWLISVLTLCDNICLLSQPYYHWIARKGSALHRSLTRDRLTVIDAKEKAIEIIKQSFPDQLDLAYKSLYNSVFNLVAEAYCVGQLEIYQYLLHVTELYREAFIKSKDITLFRKTKFEILRIMMRLGFPAKIVSRIGSFNREHAINSTKC